MNTLAWVKPKLAQVTEGLWAVLPDLASANYSEVRPSIFALNIHVDLSQTVSLFLGHGRRLLVLQLGNSRT
jgi:hypothetical protein